MAQDMRDLIALLSHWLRVLLGHATPGRHAAAHFAHDPAPMSRPQTTARPVPEHVRERFRPLIAEQVALVRPYLVAYEQQREQRLQRERRTAAVLAEVGIDYDIAAVAL